MSAVDWTNAAYADGRLLFEWLEQHELLDTARAQGNWAQKTVKYWEDGTQASFWKVDKLMTAMGRHVAQLPDGVWEAERRGRLSKRISGPVLDRLAALSAEHPGRPSVVARELSREFGARVTREQVNYQLRKRSEVAA